MNSFSLLDKNKKVHYKNYCLLLVLCLLSLWPLTFGLFSVKNDAIQYFLPYRFNITQALRNGEWPFWSPYIYLGYPLHGDMQSGAWNPVVWFLALFGRYDLTLLHVESMFYIFLGGIGMYKLTFQYSNHTKTSLIIGATYMLSGFMLNGQLINWLASAAFLPFVLNYYLLALKQASKWPAIKTGITLFLLFTAGYPSFFVFTCYLLLAIFIIYSCMYFYNKPGLPIRFLVFLRQHLIIILVFAGLSMPAILSFIELLPYYQRGSGLSYQESLTNSFELKHLLSLLFPSTIGLKNLSSGTDITMRNVYLSIFTLCFLISVPPRFSRINILLGCLAIFSLLFSLGDITPVKRICFDFLPFMNSFRHPAQCRIFFILAVLLLAVQGIKKLFLGNLSRKESQRLARVTIVAGTGPFFTVIFTSFHTEIISKIKGLFENTAEFRVRLKDFFDSIQLPEALFVNGIIQFLFVAVFLYILKEKKFKTSGFIFLWMLNMFVCAQFVLPLTFVRQTSPKKANRVLAGIEKGFPVRNLNNSLSENSKDAFRYFDDLGLYYFYNKKIGISTITNSPAFLNEQEIFIQNEFLYNYLSQKPVVYFADSVINTVDSSILYPISNCGYVVLDTSTIQQVSCGVKITDHAGIVSMTNNSFTISTSKSSSSWLVLTQNYHHHWKAWIDGKQQVISRVNLAFMGIVVPAGSKTIVFKYVPKNIYVGMMISGITILILIILYLITFIQKRPHTIK